MSIFSQSSPLIYWFLIIISNFNFSRNIIF
jgi:hypothetical protein